MFTQFFGHATRCCWYPAFYIVHAEEGIHVLEETQNEDAINAWFQNPSMIDIKYLQLYPLNKVGPIEGVFEFYHREALLSSPDDYQWRFGNMDLSISDVEYIHQELINFATNDSSLSLYHPGAPERIQFLPAQTFFSLAKVGSIVALQALLTKLIIFLKTHTQDSIADRRKAAGICVHCTYDCAGLPTPICPECGECYSEPVPYKLYY
ncbi:MAG: hypothetical protein P1U42_08270 [Phycisphaerales bacterium]|nr:hypothetical protein [Phycisphaerales bacterium]